MRGSVLVDTARVAPAQMDLDAGRLTPRDALYTGAVGVAALAVAALGGLVVSAVWSDYDYSWWRITLAVFGSLLGAGGVLLAGVVVGLMIRSWRRYEDRLDDWHSAALSAYEARQGLDQSTVYAEWDLSPSRARDVLLVALWCHYQRQQGVDAPWSVRNLTAGPLLLYGRRLGTLSESAARDVSNALADLGLVRGRSSRRAGDWAVQSVDDVVRLVLDGFSRVRSSDSDV